MTQMGFLMVVLCFALLAFCSGQGITENPYDRNCNKNIYCLFEDS
ncbi:hypothetical protein M5D96_012876 [Drosophila gunungcola]|uniref:Uncharacterized protein n=1 Tax=Drosophila gunungcola TaxID=103775 RepID=A0A9P9YCB5_9MUSC|nr:hypothetical protein M5D96_012876 [Drosophila gunungcola]